MTLRKFIRQTGLTMEATRVGPVTWRCTLQRDRRQYTTTVSSLWRPSAADVLRKLRDPAHTVEAFDAQREPWEARQAWTRSPKENRERWEKMQEVHRGLSALFTDREMRIFLYKAR